MLCVLLQELAVERARFEAEQRIAEISASYDKERNRMQQLIAQAEDARRTALHDAESEARRSMALQASQASTSVAHLEALLHAYVDLLALASR
jgi:hypothetical protein